MDSIRYGVRIQDIEVYQMGNVKLSMEWLIAQPVQDMAFVTVNGTPLSVVELSLQ